MKKLALMTSLVLLLTACGISREPDYFTLETSQGPIKPIALSLKINRPVLAGYLDRPQFTRQIGGNQILMNNTQYWAEPLDKMFMRVLASDLQQRLPASTIVTEDNYMAPDARYTIDANIDQFNLVDDARVSLKGTLIIKDRQSATPSAATPVQWTIDSGSSPSAIAQGLSTLIGKLADIIAQKTP
jgi:uncharacterized lipoprotein YmbA